MPTSAELIHHPPTVAHPGMPKIKTPKPSTHRVTSKSLTKSKSKSRSRSVGGLPALDEILDLPDELELARGPLLRVKFPGLNGNEESDDDEPPEIPQTKEELRRLYKPFPKLEVYNDDGEVLFEGPIQVLDYVHIRAGEVGGQSVEETEQWYGQITYIGAREMPKKKRKNKSGKVDEQEQPDVCLRVAWFYDHGMLDQRTLTGDDRRAIFRDRVVSQHTPKNQCIARCKLAYKPDRDIQHFCQRISCRRWFHASCLEPHPHAKNRSEDWMIDYELPPEEQQLVDIVSSRKSGSSSKPNKKVSKFENSSETEGEVEMEETNTLQRRLGLVRQLPPQVRMLATSAITRGIESGQGIVGGAYAILQARWLARKVIIEGGTLTREEEEDLAEEAKLTNPDGGPRITPRKYLCPSCADPI
ncbi:unnamed protein product [Rhizoctonia solani]|uniref:BAH domain-containing protein n=1 Tax=Rhizoctonia solani TaxID=456999 RepID=A0A8H2XE19_9AGAM|nr:unnamed protein product [Rhizoctonia solani]